MCWWFTMRALNSPGKPSDGFRKFKLCIYMCIYIIYIYIHIYIYIDTFQEIQLASSWSRVQRKRANSKPATLVAWGRPEPPLAQDNQSFEDECSAYTQNSGPVLYVYMFNIHMEIASRPSFIPQSQGRKSI